MAKLKLPDVTICSADSAFVDFTARALVKSMEGVEFGDAILFSDRPRDGPFRYVRIAPLTSVEAYSAFCLEEMVKWIRTPRVLVVQWDGYVINPGAWANTFRKFDYIGAAWHGLSFPRGRMVGNGGFSLRSHKLLKALTRLPAVEMAGEPEDRVICHQQRAKLERQFGIRYAPVKIADRFSYEYNKPGTKLPFGFHGIYHLWRHLEPDVLRDLVARMDLSTTSADRVMRLALNCERHGLEDIALTIYRKLDARLPIGEVYQLLVMMTSPQEARVSFAAFEKLVHGVSGP